MQNRKEYAYNQSSARRNAVLPEMEQTDKERGESHVYALCINFLLKYPMASILIQINIFFILTSISSPAVWITKINKCISETFFIYFIFHANRATGLCCDWRLV